MTSLGRFAFLLLVPILGLTADGPAAGLDPQQFDLVRRLLEQVRDDLHAADPSLSAQPLRSRLLVEALETINEAIDAPVPDDQLLTLPPELKDDASTLVSLVLGDPTPPPTGSPEPPPAAPVRVAPYVPLIQGLVAERRDELVEAGSSDPGAELEPLALETTAQAIGLDSPTALSDDERSFAVALARRVAGGESPPTPAADQALQDDIDALLELFKRKDASLRLADGVSSIDDRTARLTDYGTQQLTAGLHARDPNATLPDDARRRVEALASFVARGIPLTTPEPTPPPLPTDLGGGGETTDTDPTPVDPAIVSAVEGLARAVDRALIAAGLDLPTRRATLLKFILDRIARQSGAASADALEVELRTEAERLVEHILAASNPTGPHVVLPPTTVTVPTTPTTPTTPIYILVPSNSLRRCWRWW